jgi:hypothetical protein
MLTTASGRRNSQGSNSAAPLEERLELGLDLHAREEIAHSGGGDLNAVLLAELRRYLFPRCSGSSQRADLF